MDDAPMTEQERAELLELRAERRERDERHGLVRAKIAASLAKWAPALVAGAMAGGITALILMAGDEKTEGKVENNFLDLIAHLPTIGLILLIALVADYLAKYVISRRWFDEHGSAREIGTVRERIGTDAEQPQDGLAAGLAFVGNRLFAAAVAGALLLHFG